VSVVYRQAARVDHETLADDLILMNPDSHAIVVLNDTARLVWEALADGARLDDLIGLFAEVLPQGDPATLRTDVTATLDRLVEAGLAVAGEGA
jgi:hypothetical protein